MERMCSEPSGRIWEWLVGFRRIGESLEEKLGNLENHKVPDGVPQECRCDRTGRDRSVSKASDEMDGFAAFWNDFGIVDFGGF